MDGIFRETMVALPIAPLHELLRSGACTLCVFRFLRVRSHVYLPSVPSAFSVLTELQAHFASSNDLKDCQASEGAESCEICTVCLGILQNKHNAEAATLEMVQAEGHSSDDFCLEVSVPPATLVRERALWCCLRQKFQSDDEFAAEDPNGCIVPLKDTIKWLIGPQLEVALKQRVNKDSKFRISLVFKHLKTNSDVQFLSEMSGNETKRRRGSAETVESISVVQRSLAFISSENFARHFPCPPPKVDSACEVSVACRREPLLLVGRYLKYSRNISQSPWSIDEETTKGDGSVQEIIADVIIPHYKADSYKFHAAGREDIDVRMLGSGRPFILEILNARTCPTPEEVLKLEEALNSKKKQLVNVKCLKEAGNEAWGLMREGEADKQKDYTAVVWLSRPHTQDDFTILSSAKDLEIQQKTPIRVLHRRSPLVRTRTIHWMRCEALGDSEHYFLLHLCSQAGTYIKEFVHGDLGRTYPNVGSLLNCEADILCLDVTNVKMDFL